MSKDRQHPLPNSLDIMFWFSAPYPYWTERLEALQRRGKIRFEVVYTMSRDSARSWEIGGLAFPNWNTHKIAIGHKAIGIAPLLRLARRRPRVLITFYGIPETATSFLVHLLPRTRLIYYVEKTFDLVENRTPLKELLKYLLFRTADGFATPGSDADEFVMKYAGPTLKITRTDHVINIEHFGRAIALRKSDTFEKRRDCLGLKGTVFLNVGRQWQQKGIHTLLAAYQQLLSSGYECSLLLVGDGVDRQHYQDTVAQRHIERVVFLDFVQPSELPEIYALGDVFVFPTRADPWGLVVEEALAAGLPVISSINAAEIRSRIIANQNGTLVQVDDADELAEQMEHFARDADAVAKMSVQASQSVNWRTIDHWCEQIEALSRSSELNG